MAAPTDLKCEAISGLPLAVELQHKPNQLLICEKDKDLHATVLYQAETHICFYGEKNVKEGINDFLCSPLITVIFSSNFKSKAWSETIGKIPEGHTKRIKTSIIPPPGDNYN